MKKGLKLFSLLLGSTFVLAGCNEFSSGWPEKLPSADEMGIDTPWTDYTVPCTSIAFAKGEANLDLLKGETHTYSYSVEPKDFNTSLLVWESDNPAVATIQNGVLTAVGGGKANISLSYGDVMARSLVNVNVPITDFNVLNKEVSLDIEGTSQIACELSPADTTQNAIHYETESSIISVSDSGLISALGSAGDAEVKVTNEALNKVEVINVHVSDMWNYVSSLTLSGPEKLEVNKVDTLSSSVVAIDPSKEASTLAHNKVVYSVKEGSETYVSVDAETGNITGLEPGTATLVATLHEERSNTDKVDEFDVEVFEVSATAISLNETGTIELDNNENLSRLLSYTYTLSDTSFDAPSRGNVTFTSSDVNVAKVNDDGLVEVVGPGSATITVKDTTYNVSNTVDVHTTIYAKSVVLAGGVDFYLDEDVEITANVTPANTTDPLVWDYDTTTGHDFVEGGNKLIVTCNNLDNPVEVKASVGGVTSNVITLTPKEREVAFESGKTYIVGSSNFKSGISKDVDGGSWNAAKYAFVMTDKTGNAHAKYEYKATIEFRANDLWKIRENEADWRDLDTTLGRYKLNEGAFAKGQMVRSSEEADANVLVKEAGKYDVYYAYYDDTETGWYEVYVEEHGMKVSTTSVHAKLSDTVVPSVINASNYDGTLCVSEVDENYISVSVDQLTGNITITPIAVGETLFKVSDDYKEVVINVEIKEGSIVVGTDYYVRGTAVGTWDAVNANVLGVSADANNIGEILDVYFAVGDFKIGNADWTVQWGYEYDGHTTVNGGAASKFSAGESDNNIHCNVAGYYNVYLTNNNYIYIESVGGDTPVDLSSLYIRGDAVGSWEPLPENQMTIGTDNNKAVMLNFEMSVGEFKIANADWSLSWGYDYDGHATIIGGAAANFAAGEKDNNISCNVAGTYNIYLTNNNYISIEIAGEPIPPEPDPIYAYVLNNGEPVVLTEGTDDEGNPQLEALNVEMKAGESIFFENTAKEPAEALTSLTLGGDNVHGFAASSGVLTAGKDGTFNFYIKLDYGNDKVYVSEPGVPSSGYYISVNGTPTYELKANDKGEYIINVAKLNENDQIAIYNASTGVTFHAALETSFTSSFEDKADYIECKSQGYYLLCLKPISGNDTLYIGVPIVTYTSYFVMVNGTYKINLKEAADNPNYKENYSASLATHALEPNDTVDFYGVFKYGEEDVAIALKSNIFPNGDDTTNKIENNLKPSTVGGTDFKVQQHTEGTLYFNVNNDDTFGFWLTDGPTILEGFWLQVNGENVASFAYDKKEGDFEQYLTTFEVKAGDTISIYDATGKTTFSVKFNTYSSGFSESAGTITCTKNGKYDFYLKTLYGKDEIYIGEHVEMKQCTFTFTFPDWEGSTLTDLTLHCWAEGMSDKDFYATMNGKVGTFTVSVPQSVTRLNFCVRFKQDGTDKWSKDSFMDISQDGSYTITGRFDLAWEGGKFVIQVA